MNAKISTAIYCLIIAINLSKCAETLFVLNGKKSLNFVSDKFISFAVDPAVLLNGLSIRESSQELGQYLAPAYVRIAGPSTSYLQFTDDEEQYEPAITKNLKMLTYTPSLWDTLNDWFLRTNMSLIFALNDKATAKWNSREVHPLLELSSQLDMNCFWQIGFGANEKNFSEHTKNMLELRHTLDGFPAKKNEWKLVSNEINIWLKDESPEVIRKNLIILKNSSFAVMWQGTTQEAQFPKRDEMTKSMHAFSSILPVWTTIPKSVHPIAFSSAVRLAKQIGEAAALGFNVVFRELRLYELIAETPNYWFVLFHKMLMGRNVLEIRSNSIQNLDTYIYGHCARKQNSFSRRGAVTIVIINNGTVEHSTALKLPTINPLHIKHVEVQSYTLTSDGETSTNMYSNGQKLTMEGLKENMVFVPKLRRARITKHLLLSSSPKSITFYVLPDARIPICINDEDETNLLIEEIGETQSTDFLVTENTNYFEANASDLMPRIGDETTATLKDLYIALRKELEADERYYKNSANTASIAGWKTSLVKIFGGVENLNSEFNLIHTTPKVLKENKLEMLNAENFSKKRERLLQKINDQSKKIKESRLNFLKLNDNFENVTSQEIEEVVLKVTKMLKDNTTKSDSNRRKREQLTEARKIVKSKPIFNKRKAWINEFNLNTRKVEPSHLVNKRHINMKLLKQKLDDEDSKLKMLQDISWKNNKVFDKDNKIKSTKKPKIKTLQELLQQKSFLSKLLHSRREDNPVSEETSAAKNQIENDNGDSSEYLEDNGADEYEDEFEESFQSDLENYPGFHEKFGDDVKVVSPLYRKFGKVSQVNGEKNNLNSLLEKEFFIKHESEDLINKAIKNLENFFNTERSVDTAEDYNSLDSLEKLSLENEYEDIDYTDGNKNKTSRPKRQDKKHFTEEDILHYRQLMNTNIRHMRDSIKKQKLQLVAPKKHQISLMQRINRLKEAVENAQRPKVSLPPPVEKPKLLIDNIQERPMKYALKKPKFDLERVTAANNAKFLKVRLAQHKHINKNGLPNKEFVSNQMNNNDQMDDETKQLVKLIKTELRNRKPRSVQSYKQEYISRVKPDENLRSKHPEMHRNVRKVRALSDNNIKLKIERNKRYISRDGYKKQHDNSINSIMRNVDYMIPKISKNSDFTLVLPTKDEISLINTENETEISFKHILPTNENKHHNIVGISTEQSEDTTEEYRTTNVELYDVNISNVNDLLNINNTSTKFEASNLGESSLNNFLKSITDFIKNIQFKMRNILRYLEE